MTESYSKFSGLMTDHGVKSSDVSRATGISPSTLADWKSGKTVPKLDKINKIAKFFGVPIEFFCE